LVGATFEVAANCAAASARAEIRARAHHAPIAIRSLVIPRESADLYTRLG